MSDVDSPRAARLARILYRLLIQPGGCEVEALRRELGLSDRLYRKDIQRLRELEELQDSEGECRLVHERVGGTRVLRLLPADDGPAGDAVSRLGALQLARTMLSLSAGSLGDEFGKMAASERAGLRRRGARGRIVDEKEWAHAVHYLPFGAKDYSAFGPRIEAILKAILDRRLLKIRYRALAAAAAEPVEVAPFTLLVYRDGLYVVARTSRQAHGDPPQTFAVDRIDEVRPLKAKFDYPSSYSPVEHFKGAFGIYRSPEQAEPVEVVVLFRRHDGLQRYIRERRWAADQRFSERPDGRLEMRFTTTSLQEVAPWLRSFGRAVEVVAPRVDWESIGLGLEEG